ncbi:MAG TPA: hypothetical protein VGX71_05515 [Pseudaminobacter sp.]|nr:hypothetical protein [Pseudaminobacter sp.]
MAKPPPTVSLRVTCSLRLYERISAFRHEARHETRNQAMVALIAAGLAALARPVSLPPEQPKQQQLIPFAGYEGDGRRRLGEQKP